MITQSSEFTLGLTPCFTPYGFWKCIITCLHLYSIMQRSFISLNPLCSVCSSMPCPHPWQPLIFFTVSTVLLFPEYHIFQIIYYVAFLDCLISLSNVHLKFFQVFSFLLLLLLSRFSRVQLCMTPKMSAHQAPPSLGFSRQEHWSGLPFPSPMCESEK